MSEVRVKKEPINRLSSQELYTVLKFVEGMQLAVGDTKESLAASISASLGMRLTGANILHALKVTGRSVPKAAVSKDEAIAVMVQQIDQILRCVAIEPLPDFKSLADYYFNSNC